MGAFDHDLGDGSALRTAANLLGVASGGVDGIKTRFRDAEGGVIGSLYGSNYALRMSEVVDGMRGMEQELDELRKGGEHVASLLEQHAKDLVALDEDLADYARDVRRDERLADEAGADGSSPEATTAHQKARQTRQDREEDARQAKRAVEGKIAGIIGEINTVITGFNPYFDQLSPAAIRRPRSPTPPAGGPATGSMPAR